MALNNGERAGNIASAVNSTETSMRLGLARLENPTDRARVGSILEAAKLPELSFYARTLATNSTAYAEKSLEWALAHAKKSDLPVDPVLAAQVEARLQRKR